MAENRISGDELDGYPYNSLLWLSFGYSGFCAVTYKADIINQ